MKLSYTDINVNFTLKANKAKNLRALFSIFIEKKLGGTQTHDLLFSRQLLY